MQDSSREDDGSPSRQGQATRRRAYRPQSTLLALLCLWLSITLGPATAPPMAQPTTLAGAQPGGQDVVPQATLPQATLPGALSASPTLPQPTPTSPAPIATHEPAPAAPIETPTPATITLASENALLIDDWRFTSEQGLTIAGVQALLDSFPGPLKSAGVTIGDRTHSAAEVLVGQSSLYSLNPKVVLTLMELRLGIITRPNSVDWYPTFVSLVRELYHAQREHSWGGNSILFAGGYWAPVPHGTNPASYAVLRTLAPGASADQLPWLVSDAPGSFISTYTALFEDPRQPLGPLPAPSGPFLTYPKTVRSRPTSYFDHETPYLIPNGSVVTYFGLRDSRLSYDGHTGWDIGGVAGGKVVAAAAGTVMFAGNSDDGCWSPARAVVIDHGNGYRTLYWHLASLDVQTGQPVERGDVLGRVGNTGCSAGPHLHFQVTFLGRNTDPYGWCGETRDDPWAGHAFGIRSRWLWMDKPSPCQEPRGGALVVAGGEGFASSGEWHRLETGLPTGALWARSDRTPPPEQPALFSAASEQQPDPAPPPSREASATWSAQLPEAGHYRVMAQIPYLYNGRSDTTSAHYVVQSAEGTIDVEVNQSILLNDWADLGTYRFDPAQPASVTLHNTGGPGEGVWAGGVAWLPVEE